MATSAASRELFTEGVRATLNSWPVLQIAVDNGFGGVYGAQKAEWMVGVVQQYFHDNADLQQYEVEDFISQLIDQEFDTVVDDGSLPEISSRLLVMFSHFQQGALVPLRQAVEALVQRKSQRAKVTAGTQSDEESEEETQAMETEATPPSDRQTAGADRQADRQTAGADRQADRQAPQEEADGWTVVRKKK